MWIGLLAASSGQWMEQVATGWLVLELTDSPFMVAFAHGARAIPSLIMSPLGGVLADRLDRRKLLAASQFGAAGLAGVMAGLNLTHAIQTWHVFVIALLFGTVWALNNPARHSLIPTLVPRQDLMNAMAVSSSGVSWSARSNQRGGAGANDRFPIRKAIALYFRLAAAATSVWQTSRIGFRFGRPGSMR